MDAVAVKLPESPSAVGTTFQMFTRSGSGFVNDVDVAKLRAAKFDISRRTIFIIHGYQGKFLFVLIRQNIMNSIVNIKTTEQLKREEVRNDRGEPGARCTFFL